MSRPHDPPQAATTVPTAATGPQITETECKRCGTYIAGLDGRYSCGVCGWSNAWSEGHRDLPAAEEDPDYPGPAAGKTKARRER